MRRLKEDAFPARQRKGNWSECVLWLQKDYGGRHRKDIEIQLEDDWKERI